MTESMESVSGVGVLQQDVAVDEAAIIEDACGQHQPSVCNVLHSCINVDCSSCAAMSATAAGL